MTKRSSCSPKSVSTASAVAGARSPVGTSGAGPKSRACPLGTDARSMLAATRGPEGVGVGAGVGTPSGVSVGTAGEAVSLSGSALVSAATSPVAAASVWSSSELLHAAAMRLRITKHRARFWRTVVVDHTQRAGWCRWVGCFGVVSSLYPKVVSNHALRNMPVGSLVAKACCASPRRGYNAAKSNWAGSNTLPQ